MSATPMAIAPQPTPAEPVDSATPAAPAAPAHPPAPVAPAQPPAPSDPAALQECLPIDLQATDTVITRISAGMSGAGVYRVQAGDQQYALKITSPDEPIAAWRTNLQLQQAAAAVGIAPQVLHANEARRSVLSELIVDQSFPAQLGNPASRDQAIVALGQMLRRLHALPVPSDAEPVDANVTLNNVWSAIPADFALPAFVRETVEALRAEQPPVSAEPLVISHNDVNPSNLVFDGKRLMLLDWQTIAPNNAYYDLAAAAMFFRFDDDTCRKLVAAHDDAPVDVLPDAFRYSRRLAAVISGTAALRMARLRGHAGGDIAVALTPSLREVYQLLRTGTFDIGSVSGQWTFGLALVKEGILS